MISVLQHDLKEVQNSAAGKTVIIRINQIEVLRKRPDAETPCNDSLIDVDEIYRAATQNMFDCVPSYWKYFQSQSSSQVNNSHQHLCNTTNDYIKFKEYLPYNGNVERGTRLYVQPCQEMTLIFDLRMVDSMYEKGLYHIDIDYNLKSYKEIKNTRDFGLESLCSQIGGFIGICLGYSLLQVPEIITNSVTWLNNLFKKQQGDKFERNFNNQQNDNNEMSICSSHVNTTSSDQDINRLNSE